MIVVYACFFSLDVRFQKKKKINCALACTVPIITKVLKHAVNTS